MDSRRLSSAKLGALTHINAEQIRRYRGGRNEPRDHWGYPTANALKLARALDLDVNDLLPPRETPASQDGAG
jgi:hypothetical protein